MEDTDKSFELARTNSIETNSTIDEDEKKLLDFLKESGDRLSRRLSATYREAKDIQLYDKANRKIVKQRDAKLALSKIIRAVKKRDFVQLKGEQMAEIDIIKTEIPEIEVYREELLQLRLQSKTKKCAPHMIQLPEIDPPLKVPRTAE